jgi:predicted phosphoribosyltransferase
MNKFRGREDAALRLARQLQKYNDTSSVALAIPRGGVPVAAVIAKQLGIPLEIMLSKKIGHPMSSEFAIGAVSLNSVILTEDSVVSEDYIESETEAIRSSLKEKQELYMAGRSPVNLEHKNVIIIDDGIATGSTVLAIVELVKMESPAKIIIAVPVAAADTLQMLRQRVDEVICVLAPDDFRSVGQYYDNFSQVSDEEVIKLLCESNARGSA